jgi:hypothetical protein
MSQSNNDFKKLVKHFLNALPFLHVSTIEYFKFESVIYKCFLKQDIFSSYQPKIDETLKAVTGKRKKYKETRDILKSTAHSQVRRSF